ncbi:uncharacterized protein A1O9_08931 [Exophiala aquamarina CBS 119918]|uniref:Uncharacterized protein n=1 Tax=Exophiala aquamarina CBS 119918 TaxID=1182545 RepID=A0A072P6G1_9EURO|nr:uncharacterized protein A1O9_08931 [Exophiala aquamarina CBS 119918]KEF55277.1 hypothetical protein A1O9_08931 [Exophiala aquamarina CBS 119918]
MSQEPKELKPLPENVLTETQLENATGYVVDREEEKKVVRKLDRVILPLMAFVYFFQCKSDLNPPPPPKQSSNLQENLV